MGTSSLRSILVHGLLTIESKVLFLKNYHRIEFKFRCQVNYGKNGTWKSHFHAKLLTCICLMFGLKDE